MELFTLLIRFPYVSNNESDLDLDFNHFLGGFSNSVSRVNLEYMAIESAGWNIPKFAERVYCYELYHQMRKEFGDRYEYSINGELPKGRHEIIRANKSPDFLIHRSKSMESNLAIIEVKPFSVVKVFSKIDQDLCKLNYFTGDQALYRHGIMHVYGNGIEKSEEEGLIDYFRSFVENFSNKKILLSLHTRPDTKPSFVTLL